MRRSVVAVAGLCGLCGLLSLAFLPSPEGGSVQVDHPRPAPRSPARVLSPSAPVAPDRGVEPASEVLVQRVEAVRADCGLALSTWCEGGRCVAVAESPDLDHLFGWVRMAVRSPSFVISTAARDLGLGPDALPCGLAVGELGEGAEVASVSLPDGREVWCSAPRDAGWDPGVRRLCAEAARSLGLAASFDAPDLRLLSFDR